MTFYGQVRTMEPRGIANNILIFQENKKPRVPWVLTRSVFKTPGKYGHQERSVENRELFRKKVAEIMENQNPYMTKMNMIKSKL